MKLRVIFTVMLIACGSLHAHDLFLKATPFILEKSGAIVLSMNLADAFPGKEQKWRSDKTVKFWMIGPGSEMELVEDKGRNQKVQLDQPGSYTIAWNGSPSYIEIEPKIFNQYIKLEGYSDVIEAREKAGKVNSPGREKYIRFLKCFVQVGSTKTNDYSKVLGQKLELIPVANPYAIMVGSELGVRVLFEGTPLKNARVMATYDAYSTKSEDYAHTMQTDAEGIVRIPIDKPGLWLVRTNHMLPLQGDPKADWESFWANFSFQVNAQ